ncbi:receptor-type tyrosine-protein kinase FLT3 isoform X3 [Pithys albifrons albifrons]|uniref:receptor-type tyrosine-protein kinase FLT3 isoform X3 n=1 Tax=Pithys albifrons albifrons TaxID=3385563 RepID=UPI003A5D20B3
MTQSWPRSPGIPFQLAVLVMTEFAFTSTITQNTSEITCVFISQKAESSGAPETSVSSKISHVLEDLGCYLNSQGTENTYKTIRNVEVNLFEDFELRIIMSISNIVSCFWFFKERKACKLSLDSENQYIASLAFSQTKEGQAGKYTLLVTSETSNYTVVVPVLIRKKPAKPYFRKREKSDSIECISESYPQPSLEWIFCKTPEKSISSKFCNHQHQSGIYIFYAENDDMVVTKKFTLYVRRKPEITMQLLFKQISCTAESYPASSWVWRNCLELNSSNCTEEITEGIHNFLPERRSLGSWISSSILDVKETATTFSVECCANNSAGLACEKSFINLSVAEAVSSHLDNGAFYVSTGFFLLLIAFLFVFIFLKYKKQLRYESQLQMIQMIRPSDNEYIYIDFREFEYDLKWEFPRENLEFGQVLGSGAFGKVVNATAYGISDAGDSVQVAVKMLKEKPDASEEDALMSELKMMTHIGSHENIVNLLGACTVSGPIYLIFEYCCYGDLLNYLRSKREKFHWTLTDIFKQHNFSFYHNINLDQNSRMGTTLKYSVNTTLCREDEFEITQRSQKINVTPESNGIVLFSEEDKIKDASTQMEEEEDFNVLTFEDLLCFSYQVAKGMEFLESKWCIHRDLAARNILVTHGKVVKICDFGLARDVMNDSNYIVRGNARLPVKWMAPESLFERTYTMKSDVWSYGILLWEIFSLGVNPYPGIQVDTNFYKLIQNGFKMDQPYYATKEIYCMMQSCWALDCRKRPSFSRLVSSLAYQLAEAEGAVYQNMKQNAATHHCSIETKPCVSRDEKSLLFPIMLQHEDVHVEK